MGRIPTPGGSASQAVLSLGYVRPRHREIARRLVLGETQSQIARSLNMSEGRMTLIVNSPLFKLEIAKMEKDRTDAVVDVANQIVLACPEALDQVERIMYTANSEKVRLDAAKDLLDRGGFGAVKKFAGVVGHGDIDTASMQDDELRKLVQQRLLRMKDDEVAKAKELVDAAAIDIDFDEVPQKSNKTIEEMLITYND
jgi:hypothetical protein